MNGAIQLDELLRDLRMRRTRLNALAGQSADIDLDALIGEISELSEELLAADAELLAQQEQLDTTRAELEILSAALSSRAEDAPATMTTNAVGAIVSSTPSADQLLHVAAPRFTRPIATRFVVEDRPAIRTLISRVGKGAPGTQATTLARLIRGDHSTVAVRVTATAETSETSAEVQLQWLLEPADETSKVPAPPPASVTIAEARTVLDACYELSAAMSGQATVQEICQAITETAADLACADGAALALTVGPKGLAVEATTEAAREATESQFAVREGPSYAVMAGAQPAEFDAVEAQGWPSHGQYLQGLGLRHELTFPLHCRNVRATLTVFLSTERPFGADIRERLALLARHAATVLAQADVEANLRVAVHSRQQVGQAVGILIERHRITPQAAFDRLVHASNISQSKLRDLAAQLVETGVEPELA